mgnify:CR=1 FL=1
MMLMLQQVILVNKRTLLQRKYIKNNGVNVAANTGEITVEFDKGGIAGKQLKITPTINHNKDMNEQVIEWVCSTNANASWLPNSCQ